MREVRADGFRMKRLRAHSILAGVPLRTLSRIDLHGGREGMTIGEISSVVGFGGQVEVEVGPVTRILFWLRSMIGRILHWDDAVELVDSLSYLSRLNEDDRARSVIEPGKTVGISRVLYCFENEYLAEIINRTVHCFWLLVSERTATGYALYIAIYVKKLNWFTPIYMALISPLLKWIVYPSMEEGIKRRWTTTFPRRRSHDKLDLQSDGGLGNDRSIRLTQSRTQDDGVSRFHSANESGITRLHRTRDNSSELR